MTWRAIDIQATASSQTNRSRCSLRCMQVKPMSMASPPLPVYSLFIQKKAKERAMKRALGEHKGHHRIGGGVGKAMWIERETSYKTCKGNKQHFHMVFQPFAFYKTCAPEGHSSIICRSTTANKSRTSFSCCLTHSRRSKRDVLQ